MTNSNKPVLVLGGTGKTGSRVAAALRARSLPVRIGSRSATPPFDWTDRDTWDATLTGVAAVYISYQPDLAAPGAPEAIHALTAAARRHGVRKLVLLSGRGEPEAAECEEIVRNSGIPWTILRCSWFAQNFSEGAFTDLLRAGAVALPTDAVTEPFIDAADIAAVAVAALTDDRHAGAVYELTGPRALTFSEAIAEIARATGRDIAFVSITRADFVAALTTYGVPTEEIGLLDYLFGTVLDGRNSATADGVERALGRKPQDFTDYVRETAATGVWAALEPSGSA
ncbi:SDR family oxidoreductase [Nocardia thraciensis]